MRIAMDCTPLLGRRTGVGAYTDAVLRALAAEPDPADSLVATAFSLRGRAQLAGAVPTGVAVRSAPVPARLLREAWARSSWPPAELLCGPADVFHATNFVLPALRRARGVLTIHDLAFLHHSGTVSPESLRYQELVPRGLRRAAVVCTPSHAVATQVQEAYRIDADRVVVTHLGVAQAWFRADRLTPSQRGQLGLPAEYLLAVGTLEPRKNLSLLVAAYAQLLDRAEEVPPLVLVGGTGWGDALDTGALPPQQVVRTGHLDTEVLRGVVAGASALAFPSLDEGFGLPPLEALAAGVSVVSADLPVTREVLGPHAVFASPRSVDDFAEALLVGLRNPPTTAEQRRAHAATFTWSACARRTHAAYRMALAD